MRVTDQFRTRTVIRNLNTSRERLTTLQEQLSSAKRVNRPSDDPISAAKSMRLRSTLEGNAQYESNIDDTVGFLDATELALQDAHNILLDIRDLTLQAANDATSPREDLADQLELILRNLAEVANTKFRSKYIFAGTETLALPFTINENEFNLDLGENIVEYRGNNKEYSRQINENTKIGLNVPGDDVFIKSGGTDMFQSIWNLRNHLLNDDTDSIRDSLNDIDASIDQVLDAFLTIGTKKQLAVFNDERFLYQGVNLKERISHLEDTDFGEAFVQFKAEENALNSALSAGARVISPSLLDYIGGV